MPDAANFLICGLGLESDNFAGFGFPQKIFQRKGSGILLKNGSEIRMRSINPKTSPKSHKPISANSFRDRK